MRNPCAAWPPRRARRPRAAPSAAQHLAEQPYAVICDLSGLHALDPACASVFSSVATHPGTSRPGTSLLLCGARPQVAVLLRRLRRSQFLPIYPTVQAALAGAGARPPCLHEELALAPSLAAPAAARRFVRHLCRSWRLDELGDPDEPSGGDGSGDLIERAVLLASELVANAVMHGGAIPAGGGGPRLLVELRGRRLRLAVQDATTAPPALSPPPRAPGLEAESGRGLQLVDCLATSWGSHALPEGGKIVWCILKY